MSSCFWSSNADIGAHTEFQVSLLCDPTVDISELLLSSLRLSFSDGRPDVEVKAGDGSTPEEFIDIGTVDDREKTQDATALVWTPGKRITLRGRLVGTQESEVEVSFVELTKEAELTSRLPLSSSS